MEYVCECRGPAGDIGIEHYRLASGGHLVRWVRGNYRTDDTIKALSPWHETKTPFGMAAFKFAKRLYNEADPPNCELAKPVTLHLR